MKRIVAGLGALALGLVGAVALVSPAHATDPILVQSTCLTDWYVNPDEGPLLPDQTVDGLLFDGPSLVHHAIGTPFPVADLDPGLFVADLEVGVLPLFKVETLNPYSTLNYVGGGLWWSSKITSGPGSQSSPQTPEVIAGTSPYTATSVVFSFGVGYANDVGNKATVSSVTFAGKTYDLTCQPPATPTTPPSTETVTTPPVTETTTTPPVTETTTTSSVTETTTVTETGTGTGTTTGTTHVATTALPTTGSPFAGILLIGIGLIGLGAVTLGVLFVRRRHEGAGA